MAPGGTATAPGGPTGPCGPPGGPGGGAATGEHIISTNCLMQVNDRLLALNILLLSCAYK